MKMNIVSYKQYHRVWNTILWERERERNYVLYKNTGYLYEELYLHFSKTDSQ